MTVDRVQSSAASQGRHPLSGHPVRVGVMGSAATEIPDDVERRCRELGREIARAGCCLLTGACSGMPEAAVRGAKEEGGHVIGISPAESFRDHVEVFGSPWEDYDVLIYTGLGFMGRELINIRSSDIVICVGGGSGTLGEYAIAYDEGKLIGVLTGTGGVSDVIEQINRELHKETGAEVYFGEDPDALVKRLLGRFQEESYRCPCEPALGRKSRPGTADEIASDPSCNCC